MYAVFKPGACQPQAGTCLVFKIVPVRTSVFVFVCLCVCVSVSEAINNYWRDMDLKRLVKQVL